MAELWVKSKEEFAHPSRQRVDLRDVVVAFHWKPRRCWRDRRLFRWRRKRLVENLSTPLGEPVVGLPVVSGQEGWETLLQAWEYPLY